MENIQKPNASMRHTGVLIFLDMAQESENLVT